VLVSITHLPGSSRLVEGRWTATNPRTAGPCRS
jgi:hypothetical protein